MAKLLLISDDPLRAKALLRDLGMAWACCISNLYDDVMPPLDTPDLILSDVKRLTSEAVLRLRQLLTLARGPDVPYLCLLPDDSARSHAHSNMLGASATLGASASPGLIIGVLTELLEQVHPAPQAARQYADIAQYFLRDNFVSDREITPDLVDIGTRIVADAVREVGIHSWVQVVRQFDDATHQHCLLVAGLACAFSSTLGLNALDRHRLGKAALLHDVGKIHVPLAILNKPGRLDEAEMAVMRTHSARGHAMLVGKGFDQELLAVVRSHHEMLDGSGYPDRLKEYEIPDLVRLVTVCDVYAALIERRPYRAPMSSNQALSILKDMGGRLDANLVSAFRPVADAFSAAKDAGIH